jgi:hypothetical protein
MLAIEKETFDILTKQYETKETEALMVIDQYEVTMILTWLDSVHQLLTVLHLYTSTTWMVRTMDPTRMVSSYVVCLMYVCSALQNLGVC